MNMKGYERYIEDVKSGKIPTSLYIKQAVARFESLLARDDIFLDVAMLDKYFALIGQMKHFRGKTAGKPFVLEPWQEFIIANLVGLRYKESNRRVCKETYIQVSRKCGKDALVAAIIIAIMILEDDRGFQGACLANSREQSRVLFEYIDKFSKSIDPKGQYIKHYKNYVSMEKTDSVINVYSSDASKLDGLSASVYCVDEYHEAKDRKLYDVMKSSTAFRESPLGIIISTAGFHLEGPCHDMYLYSLEVLSGTKNDESFFPFLYVYEGEDIDNWDDPKNFIKVQPNLGVTVDEEFMIDEARKAKNDPTAENGIKVKTFNMWVQSATAWLPVEKVVKCMDKIDYNDFYNEIGYLSVDLSSNNDLTALTLMIPKDGKFYYWNWAFLPEATMKEHPNRELYAKFMKDTECGLDGIWQTPGNITDYDYVTQKILDIMQVVTVQGVYYDPYNSGTWSIQCTNLGIPMFPFRQGLMSFSPATKEFERQILNGEAVINKCPMVLWEIQNTEIKEDAQQNRKPQKAYHSSPAKIDNVITQVQAVGGYLQNPIDTSFEIIGITL